MTRFLPFLLSMMLALCGTTLLNAAQTDAERLHDVVSTKVAAITEILNDATLEKAVKNDRIMAIAEEMIDFEIMAKLSLGKEGWAQLDEAQQHEFITLYVEHIKSSYLEKLYLYNGEKIRITPAVQPKPNRIEISSFIRTDEGEMEILYKFYRNRAGAWFIYDINLAGVSIIQTNRVQFAEFLSSATAADLLEKLRQEEHL